MTAQDVEESARKTLGLDEEPDKSTPDFYLQLFTKHVEKCPRDTNFIVELADPKKKGSTLGGNGFGVVTCMEDYCWKEVILSADPERPEGGKTDGFGSFSDFQDHCKESGHIKGRDERCTRLGIPLESPIIPVHPLPTTISSSSSSSSLPLPPPHTLASSPKHDFPTFSTSSSSSSFQRHQPVAGPSSQPSSSFFDHHPSSSSTSHRDIKPSRYQPPSSSYSARGSAMDDAISLSDSDSEVLALSDTEVPAQYKKVTNKDNPIPLSDDDDDDDDGEIPIKKYKHPSTSQRSTASRHPLAPIFQVPRVKSEKSKGKEKESGGLPMEEDGSTDSLASRQKKFDELFGDRLRAKPPVPPAPKTAVPASFSSSSTSKPGQMQDQTTGIFDRLKAINAASAAAIATPQDASIHAIEDKYKLYGDEYRLLLMQRKKYGGNIDALVEDRLQQIVRGEMHATQPYIAPSEDLLRLFPQIRQHLDGEKLKLARLRAADAIKNAGSGPSSSNRPNHYPAIGADLKPQFDPFEIPGMPGAWQPPSASLTTNWDDAMIREAYRNMVPGHPLSRLDGMGMSDDEDDPFGYDRFGIRRQQMTNEGLTQFFDENLKDFLEDTTVDESLQTLGLTSLTDHLPGLVIQLMPHQVLGVSFMIEKEKNQKYRGGINGDSMGLGKTVQSIALMAANPSQDRKVKTTLIVAPLALLSQWKNEIESKTTPGLMRVLIYHGQKRIKTGNNLKQYDVVMTTYGTLTSEFGSEHKHKKKVKIDDPDASEDDENFVVTRKQGPLMKVKWYRVILDEAHQIRNKNTRATKACFALNAHLRWSLTGTLIMNSLDDIYAHLHFLQISPSREWEHFRDSISKVQKRSPKLATKRVQAILRTCCIRRNKESMLNGKKLLELPPKTTEVVTLAFTDEERQIYTAIENKFQVKFNSFLKKGTVMKHYSIMLVMLMRLRQLTCHPWLLRRNPQEGMDPRDVLVTDEDLLAGINAPRGDNISELARAATLFGQEYVEKVKKMLAARLTLLVKADPDDADAQNEGQCSVCFDEFTDEIVTPCCHSFCATCLEDVFNSPTGNADMRDEDVQAGRRNCPLCRSVIDKSRVFRAEAFMPQVDEADDDDGSSSQAEEASEPDEADIKGKAKMEPVDDDDYYQMSDKKKGKRRANDDGNAGPSKKSKKGKEKANGANGALDDVSAELAMEDVLPSTKMKQLGALIDAINEEDPSQKVIVFSQFVQYIDLCGMYLGRRGVNYVSYVGSMKQDEREETIRKFNRPAGEEGSPKVILMSLKCGGVGLNLCAANHVICLDLAWNAATENQAVDRAHRIGQTKEVKVHRLVIENTVEQRIMTLQESKQALSDGAMGEGNGGRLGRLSINDLIKLFGVNARDED
ncbi:hypothetical protein CI109_100168 [Kwoniella shandongensis]|uniref:Uncharacterized protein n=1 Tax=Kwoniella shandongensis TaxID=1734106 RepID=A0A5M6BSR3_9TREE|nr:uncharacterized protein CI109_005768 [Kwoniella shandongensis]KAA5525886.1 hypothetical protein CI109_005768 [Kwoniella shandongensis]